MHDLLRGEVAAVEHAREDARDVVLRLGHSADGRGDRRVRAAREELEARRASAIRKADGSCQLDTEGTWLDLDA